MYLKLHKTKEFTILACSDKELVGKTLKEKKIEITVEEKFYKGKLASEKELKKLIKQADSINLLGKKCIEIALKEGFIKENDIIKINGIPHVQIYKI